MTMISQTEGVNWQKEPSISSIRRLEIQVSSGYHFVPSHRQFFACVLTEPVLLASLFMRFPNATSMEVEAGFVGH